MALPYFNREGVLKSCSQQEEVEIASQLGGYFFYTLPSFETLRMKALLADRLDKPSPDYKTTKPKPKGMEFKPSTTMTFTYYSKLK